MVRFISAQETLDLRSKILRNGLSLADCIFPTDQIEGAFHLGCFVDELLVSVASFFPNHYQDRKGLGYQLRGMATAKAFAGKGYGAELIDFAIIQLNAAKANYLWCNARSSAIEFYKKKGFELSSDEFEIEGVGPHYEMIINLK
ncbi:GNAT family N-acetyltransferase [Pedobacter sp. Du54]|uniref:GNAT family N-acetyltransferase n=1 Tax=Pedobacter anseongensis TaxID=3133439 RepID=UPI0030B2138D